MHAMNLAKFATIYKLTMLALKNLSTGSSPSASISEGPYDTFLAGLLGGYMVFGRASPRSGRVSSVNQQIVIYVFARVVLGLAKLSVEKGIIPDRTGTVRARAWPIFAASSWGAVMWLFRWYPEVLATSLRGSMDYM